MKEASPMDTGWEDSEGYPEYLELIEAELEQRS